jgi:hypothetical protein
MLKGGKPCSAGFFSSVYGLYVKHVQFGETAPNQACCVPERIAYIIDSLQMLSLYRAGIRAVKVGDVLDQCRPACP